MKLKLLVKKSFFIVVFCLFTLPSRAEKLTEIRTIINQDLTVTNSFSDDYHFAKNDSVTIIGYKKKDNRHFFAVNNKYYAEIISMISIPFPVDEKQLKKLPNAQASDIKDIINRKNELLQIFWRKQALDRKVMAIAMKNIEVGNYPKKTIAEKGDTIQVVGYRRNTDSTGNNTYSILSKHNYGECVLKKEDIKFLESIDINLLPNKDDNEVAAIFMAKQREITKQKDEKKRQIKEKALNGRCLVALRHSISGTEFKEGNQVSLLGIDKEYAKYKYAMYSNNDAGVVSSYDSPNDVFFSSIDWDWELFPSTTDEDVIREIKLRKETIDSVRLIEEDREIRRLEHKNDSLFNNLSQQMQRLSPVGVKVSWSSNSIGGIDISVVVFNCSLQTIKYITLTGYFTNPVGDKCKNLIGGGYSWKVKGIGPIGPRPKTIEYYYEQSQSFSAEYNFDTVFYSETAEYIHVTSIIIQYMNGKTVTLSGSKLSKHLVYK